MSVNVLPILAAPLVLFALGAVASDHGKRSDRLVAKLKPTEEVPALSSPADGWFKVWINEANQTISYELSYEDLEGAPLQAHIHIGQRGANGGISVFLCGNAPAVPPETFPQPPACPPSPATVSGELTPANIVGPAGQGIEASSQGQNEFGELIRMVRRGLTYANVHSTRFPAGEIRGQVLSTHKRR